jgi:hypothetical protein
MSYHKRPFFARNRVPFAPWLPVLSFHWRIGRWQ